MFPITISSLLGYPGNYHFYPIVWIRSTPGTVRSGLSRSTSKCPSRPSPWRCQPTACRCWRTGWCILRPYGAWATRHGGNQLRSSLWIPTLWGTPWLVDVWNPPKGVVASACFSTRFGFRIWSSRMSWWRGLRNGKNFTSNLTLNLGCKF